MPLYELTQPAAEPVTLQQVKDTLRVSGTEYDAELNLLIPAARRLAENFTRRRFIAADYLYTLDRFPFQGYGVDRLVPAAVYQPQIAGSEKPVAPVQIIGGIRLPRPPVSAIKKIEYLTTQTTTPPDTWATYDAANYRLIADPQGAIVAPLYNQWWPVALLYPESVKITYTAGYGTAAASVPVSVVQAIVLTVYTWYVDPGAEKALPKAAEALLWSERAMELV